MGTRPAIQVVPKQTDTTHRKHQGWSPFRVTRRSQIKLTHSMVGGPSLGQLHAQLLKRFRVKADCGSCGVEFRAELGGLFA